jgi:uncharacterized membrane protein YeaQ/YmgE (transglycosylase-associated protein family)
LIPRDAMQGLRGPTSWVLTVVLGLVGAYLGWLLFTRGLGIGDNSKFDLGGILGAIVGAVVVLGIATILVRRTRRKA